MTDPAAPAAEGPAPERRLFARLWRTYLRHQTGLLVLAFALMAVEGTTLGALATMLEPLFDQVFAPGNDRGFLWIAWAVLGLFVLRAAVLVLGRVVLTTAQQRVSVAMQGDLLRHVLTLDGAFFRDNAPGALIERVQGDALAVQGIWTSVLAGVGRDVVGLVALLIVALRIDPIWTLATLVGAPLLIVPAALGQRYIRRKSEQLRQQAGLRATRLDEIFHGIQAVKLNRMEEYQAGRFRRIADTIVRAEVRQAFGRIMMPALVDVVTGIGFFVVLVLAGSQIAAGERTTGEFMSFFAAITLTFTPIRRLAEQAGIWQVAKASLARIFDLLDHQPQTRRPLASLALPPPGPPELRFDSVSFAHGAQPVLHDVSFVAEAGKMTALVGASGAGKTTLFQLLTGLIEPDAGEVRVGGAALSAMTLADQRALFAYVTQDVALFDETVEENVLLGQTGISRDRLDEALAAAHVTDFLDLLPGGKSARVGPRGSALSGGQRQRVAIARALVREAPVLLLDEATSALDSASEQAVTEALGALSGDRTVLVIAHRLSTVRDAAKIVVLAAGRVVEQGTHDELLARGGTYAGLHKLQLRE